MPKRKNEFEELIVREYVKGRPIARNAKDWERTDTSIKACDEYNSTRDEILEIMLSALNTTFEDFTISGSFRTRKFGESIGNNIFGDDSYLAREVLDIKYRSHTLSYYMKEYDPWDTVITTITIDINAARTTRRETVKDRKKSIGDTTNNGGEHKQPKPTKHPKEVRKSSVEFFKGA